MPRASVESGTRMVLPATRPVNRRPAGSVTVAPDSRVTSGSSKTMATAPGTAARRAPGAGAEETGTACAEAGADSTSSKAAAARTRPPSRAAQPPLARATRRKAVTSGSAPGRPSPSVQHNGEDAQHDQGQQDGHKHRRVILRRAGLGQPGRVAFPAYRPAPHGRLTAAHALVVRAPLHDRYSLDEGHYCPVRRWAPP